MHMILLKVDLKWFATSNDLNTSIVCQMPQTKFGLCISKMSCAHALSFSIPYMCRFDLKISGLKEPGV